MLPQVRLATLVLLFLAAGCSTHSVAFDPSSVTHTGQSHQSRPPQRFFAGNIDITIYSIPTANSGPVAITPDKDGGVWFTESNAGNIGHMDRLGRFAEYPIPNGLGAQLLSIAIGPDKNVWFTAEPFIGRMTASAVISEFVPPAPHPGIFQITPGPDGNLWFVEFNGNNVGRITPSGAITEFPVPTFPAFPFSIAAGADGNLWFTEENGNKLGRITTAGTITEFPISIPNAFPDNIVAGSDDDLWFIEDLANNVVKVKLSGEMTTFPIPTKDSFSGAITLGCRNNIWFTEEGPEKIASVSPGGHIREFSLPHPDLYYGIAPDPLTGGLRLTGFNGNVIIRVDHV